MTQVSDKLRDWLGCAVRTGASDLHLIAGHPPVLRLHGDLEELPEPPIDPADADAMLAGLCPPGQLDRLRVEKDIDFSLELPLQGKPQRFRVNLFHTGRRLGACLRVIPTAIPDFDWAGFPLSLAERIAFTRDGLVILSGATGSGKTTSLAMIVNLLNQTGGYRIITIEEPIEYQFPKMPNSLITQREVGGDVVSFADGLKYGLRQDPDVILVGEIRDRETAQIALSAAETGHLVLTTLHTRDAKGAITRFADLFPQDGQKDVRGQLAMSLRAVLSQRLLPGTERGSKRELALEVLWNNNPVSAAIRQGKIESLDTAIVTGREEGMISLDESVRQLYRAEKITREVAEQNMRDLGLLHR